MRALPDLRGGIRLLTWLGLLLGSCAPTFAQAGDNLLPVTEAYRLSADSGTPGTLKLHWTIAPDYYLYRGRMTLTPGEGVQLGQPHWPDGEKHHDEYLGDVETYHHVIDASVPYTLAAGATRLRLSVQYQGCHEVDPKICYPPHTEQLDLPLPAAAIVPLPRQTGTLDAALRTLGSRANSGGSQALPPEQAFRFDALASAPHQLLLRWTMPKGYYLYRDQTRLNLVDGAGLSLQPRWPVGTRQHDEHYGEVTVYYGQLELPVAVVGDLAGRHQLQLDVSFQGCQQGGICYPVMNRGIRVDLPTDGASSPNQEASPAPAQAPPPELPQLSLVTALLLALAGGLVLNLMPCVLPILSIKAVSVLESGESRAHARRHALLYTAGVLSSFAALGLGILALRSAGHAFGWGTQLQQPVLVAVLACVMLAVGLSMSGIVQFGTSLGGTGAGLAAQGGAGGDFFTGVLAVVVASPCTAPFMGSALAYAFAAPMLAALLVFVMLGVGLALPFLAIGFVPALARRLPRPGRWMETLKQVLAFPMYLTAVWLVWVLAHQRGADAVGLVLVAMVLLAMTLWWFERSRAHGWPSKLVLAVLMLVTVVPLVLLAQLAPPQVTAAARTDGSVAYTPQALARLRSAGTPVFVDITADWCITCKANAHTVLDTPAFHELLQRTGTVYMKGDWTNVDPVISTFLQQYHSPGVPLYVVFPRHAGPGRQLSTVLSQSLVEQALTEAAR